MKRSPRARIMTAKALTSPEPEFVSQVRAGANQEPLRVVKMDMSTVEEIVALFEAKEISMKDAVKKAKAAGLDIIQLVFRGGDFPDRASVDAWLKEGGYESGYEVTEKTDNGVTEFTVASTVTKFKAGTSRKVKGQADGLTVFVGEVEGEVAVEKTSEEQTEEEVAAKGSAITSAKGDNETDVEATAEAAATETQEAAKAEEAVSTEVKEHVVVAEKIEAGSLSAIGAQLDKVTACATVAKSDEPTSAQKADTLITELRTKGMYEVSSLGSILRELKWMVTDADYNDLSDEAVSLIKGAANALIDALVGVANDAIGDMVEVFKSDALKTDEPVSTEEATTAQKSEEPVAQEVAKTDPALLEILGKLTSAIGTISEDMNAMKAEIAEVKTTAVAKADEEASKGQTRKGADVVQPAATTEEAETKKKQDIEQDHAKRRLRSAFGSYKGNGFTD